MFTFPNVMIALLVLTVGVIAVVFRKEFGGKGKKSAPGDKPADSKPVPVVDALTLRGMLEKSDAPVIVMFYGDGCPACDIQKPNFQEAADTHKGNAQFVFVNVRENRSTSRRLGIDRIPTTMVFVKSDETPLARRTGVFDPVQVNAFIANAGKQ